MKRHILILLAMLYVIPSFSQTMEWHVKDIYTDIKYMGNDLFKVKNASGKWGIVNEYGETTVQIQYDSITPFVENRALLLDITGQYLIGIINEKGQLIKSFSNNEIISNYQYFSEGMLAYGVPAGTYYSFGYLDINGNPRIEPKYYWAAPFSDGKAVIQYRSGNYGLINKIGGAALFDNRKFKFMSTPVNNHLLIAAASSRGDKVILAALSSSGKLSEIHELESGTTVKNSNDYRSISCQNGHVYYFDNAMRLISSSTGTNFNVPLVYDHTLPVSSQFKKIREQGGWKILRSGNTLLNTSFKDVTFCGDSYAIVTFQKNTLGILKYNPNGSVSVQSLPGQAEFYHNAPVRSNIAVNLSGLSSSTQVQIGVVGLKENGMEEKYQIPAGYSGIYNQQVLYFIPSDSFDKQVSIPLKVNIYINGMLYKSEEKVLTGVHINAFRISEANSPEFSDSEGNATITFNVQSMESVPSPSAKVTVSGASSQTKRFNGDDLLYFKVPVTVPVESVRTFTFTVTVTEDGCPSYTKTIKRTIKHYDLQ